MKRAFVFALIIFVSISLSGCLALANKEVSNEIKYQNQALPSNEDEGSLALKAANEYVKEIDYKVAINSGAYQKILLPSSFIEDFDDYSIGSFLKEKNEESKLNGLDFKDYLGKEVILFTYGSEAQEGDLVLLIAQGVVIGAWIDPTENSGTDRSDFTNIVLHTKNI